MYADRSTTSSTTPPQTSPITTEAQVSHPIALTMPAEHISNTSTALNNQSHLDTLNNLFSETGPGYTSPMSFAQILSSADTTTGPSASMTVNASNLATAPSSTQGMFSNTLQTQTSIPPQSSSTTIPHLSPNHPSAALAAIDDFR